VNALYKFTFDIDIDNAISRQLSKFYQNFKVDKEKNFQLRKTVDKLGGLDKFKYLIFCAIFAIYADERFNDCYLFLNLYR